jgi:hypothetical protein
MLEDRVSGKEYPPVFLDAKSRIIRDNASATTLSLPGCMLHRKVDELYLKGPIE